MKRIFDLFFGLILLLFLVIIMLLIAIAIRLTSKGPLIYWSDRIGKNNKIFKMPKFRSMLIDTPAVATHLLDNPDSYLSPVGKFLRTTSLDELPQLFSVLKGEMSFVGPRPALYNQDDLISLRTKKGVDKLLPGITGWAQVNGLRGPTDTEGAMTKRFQHDLYYIKNWNLMLDVYILVRTIFVVLFQRVD